MVFHANAVENTARKIANPLKHEDVISKRGLISSLDLLQWVKGVREGGAGRRAVTITLLDEARNPVATFRLTKAQPRKRVGPTLAAKGGGDGGTANHARRDCSRVRPAISAQT